MAHVIMRGTSMQPTLREGMILEVECGAVEPRKGDIAVFRAGERLVAHRVVRRASMALICCGDAQPDRLDVVPLSQVVGTVSAVYRTQNGRLRRADGAAFRLSGRIYAQLQPFRALVYRLAPRKRERVYAALVAIAGALVRNDTQALLAHVESVTSLRLAEVAKKHRVGAMLCEALERYPENAYARAVRSHLQRVRWSVIALAPQYRAQVLYVLQCLRESGIEPVLLKGAARAFRRQPGWMLHQSGDIDVLVGRDELKRACESLRRRGYAADYANATPDYYEHSHHHAAPLYPPDGGVCVEIHHALRPDLLDLTTRECLRSHIVRIDEDDGTADLFDATATAAHMAIHSAPRAMLRDVVLLSEILKNMTHNGRAGVLRLVDELSPGDVRARAAVALAAQLAGLPLETDMQTQRFVDWMIRREDLPRPLRARPESVDAWLAARRSRIAALAGSLLDAASGKNAAARAGAAFLTAFYLPFTR
jgi:hypothetical protein